MTADGRRALRREQLRRQATRRMELRTLVDCRWVASDAVRHGLLSSYTNWYCRCPPCTAANTAATAERRARRT